MTLSVLNAPVELRARHLDKMAAVSQFASGLSRDVATLVQEAEGAVRQVLAAGDSPSLQYQRLEEAAAALQRVGLITRQLGVLAERSVSPSSPRSLADAVTPLVPLVRRLAGESIMVEVPPFDPSAWASLQAGHVEQVLFHLVVNARDAMPSGGSLQLNVTRRQVTTPLPHRYGEIAVGEWSVLELRDDGCGMNEKTLNRLFEPFFTTKPLGQGSGLGLATIYGVVHQADGQVLVESTEGRGTAVSVWLPALPADSSPPLGVTKGSAVLVVDEDDWVRTVTGRMLRRAGYGVMEAPQATDALAILSGVAGQCIQVVVVDGSMPGSPGQALARRLAYERPDVRVILTTGQHGPDGPVGFLRTPFSREQLIRAVRGD